MVDPAIEEKAAPGRRQHRHRTLRLATPLAGRLEGETVHEVNLVGGGDEPCGSDKAASADSAPAVGRVILRMEV